MQINQNKKRNSQLWTKCQIAQVSDIGRISFYECKNSKFAIHLAQQRGHFTQHKMMMDYHCKHSVELFFAVKIYFTINPTFCWYMSKFDFNLL